MRIIKII